MNRTTRISAPIAIAATAALAFSGAAQAAATDEQTTLDAAVESFGERLTASGWELTGIPTSGPTGDTDDSDPDDDDDGGDGFEDALSECIGEDTMAIFESVDTDAERPQASSGEYSFAAAVEGSSEFGVEETVELNLVSLSDDDLVAADALLDQFGSDELGDCFVDMFRTELEREIAGGSDEMAAMIFEAMEFETTGESDLGIGDRSARLGISIGLSMVIELSIDMTIDIAIADGRLAMLMYMSQSIGAGDDESSGFDPIAELEQIVADLSD